MNPSGADRQHIDALISQTSTLHQEVEAQTGYCQTYKEVDVSPMPKPPRMVQNSIKPQTFACHCLSPSVDADDSANRCCGADLGQLGLLRHIPHTTRAKDVSAQLIGCNWSPGHDMDIFDASIISHDAR